MMKKRFISGAVFVFVSIVFAGGLAFAVDPIPKEAGFGGFFRPGAGYMDIESNMVAEFMGTDLSKDSISSLTKSPDGESNGTFSFAFQVSYTFSDLATQIFLGPELSDVLRFDLAQQLGVKRQMGDLGILQAGILFSPFATEVWSDPYVTNRNRRATDRDSRGAKLGWGDIMGSGLDLEYKYRNLDIDEERSGEFLGLSGADRKLLERDADIHQFEVIYQIKLDAKSRLVPSFTWQIDDRDGGARENDEYRFQLTYAYLGGDPFSVTVNGVVGWADYDKRNPIPDFNNKRQEDDLYGLNATIYYKNPWGWTLWGSKPINFFVEGAWFERDANIDFYDEQIVSGTAGAMFRW